MSAALVGAVVATVAVFFVLWPLFAVRRVGGHDSRRARPPAGTAALSLHEIEFDRATGKLEGADYERLKAVWADRSLGESFDAAAAPANGGAAGPDRAEALISAARGAARSCAECGADCPEPDAAFCSTCGARLPAPL